ncbi:MAG: response regulator, partial [Acidobacteriota bacterium]
IDIAKGLSAAHARGIVHRDLKTENVIVSVEGTAKILDFGLATDPTKASPGRVQGTPRSMSPEQAMGDAIDYRSDLFSLGVLLYECLSGESPFVKGARDAYQILWRVCTFNPRPLVEICPGLPQELSDLVDRLLEKDPQDRPSSAEAVILGLQRAEGFSQTRTRVLFVDDEPDFEPLLRQWFRRRFGRGRFELRFAGNGAEALEVLSEDKGLHLVFTDLRMPEMDGLGLLGEIGTLGRSCVSVVVSAFGDMENIRAAMNLGAFDFLTKPFDFKDLEATLEKASRQVAVMREGVRLRAENQLLEERNKVIRVAFGRYLQGDPDFGQAFEPVIEHLQAASQRQLTLLSLQVDGFEELPSLLEPDQFMELTRDFISDLVNTVRLHRGDILGFEEGRLSIGFGYSVAREIDADRAQACAEQLLKGVEEMSTQSVGRGGPQLEARLLIDTGDLVIDDLSGSLSGMLLERADQYLGQVSRDEILVLDTLRQPTQGETALDTALDTQPDGSMGTTTS